MKAAYGEGVYRIEAEAAFCGEDISVRVCGGMLHHIGAVSLATYERERDSATVSTICVQSHRDDKVSGYFAKEISREMCCTVSVSAGIHVDDAGDEDIRTLWQNSVNCCKELIEALKEVRP